MKEAELTDWLHAPPGAAPGPVARIAALPVTHLRELRFDKTWQTIAEVREISTWLRDEGSRLADDLFHVIGVCPPSAKPALVAVRRAVHSVRLPRPRVWNPTTRAVLAPPLAAAVDRWCGRLADRERLLEVLPQRFADERREMTERLRVAVSAAEFRYGLVQGSPVLFTELEKWLATPPGTPLDRQSELRLAKYLARAVAKISPYSTFTISGFVPWRSGTSAMAATGDWTWRSAVELNVWLIQRISGAVIRHPQVAERLRLRPNSSLRISEGIARFLSSGTGMPVASLRYSTAVGASVDLVRSGAAATPGELREHLARIDPEVDPVALGGFVHKLTEIGLLDRQPPFDDQADDPLLEMIRWLQAEAPAVLAPVSALLESIHADLMSYPQTRQPAARLATHRRISEQIGAVLADPRFGDSGTLPAKNLYHENAVFTQPVISCGSAAWEPVVDDLRRLRRMLAVTVPTLAGRLALGAYFAGRWGVGKSVPWLDFYQDLQRFLAAGNQRGPEGLDGETLRTIFAGPVLTPPARWRDLPFAAQASEISDRVTDRVRSVVPDVDGVVRLSSAAMDDIVGELPGHLDVPESVAWYLQVVADGEPLTVVVNAATSGFGRGRSRLRRLADLAGADLPPWTVPGWAGPDRQETGCHYVEVQTAFGSNLNLRRPGVTAELDFPYSGAGTGRPQVSVGDLEVVHDPQTGRVALRHRGDGRRVLVVHNGMMGEFFLPPPLANLMDLLGPAPSLLHAGYPLFLPRTRDPAAGGVGVLPRVQVGSVVVARRTWAFRVGELPRRAHGEPELGWWQRLAEWIGEHDIPHRCYVRVMPLGEDAGMKGIKARKPTYIDFSNWYLVALLDRAMTRDDDLVVLSEALPDLDHAPRFTDGDHVTELLLEVNSN